MSEEVDGERDSSGSGFEAASLICPSGLEDDRCLYFSIVVLFFEVADGTVFTEEGCIGKSCEWEENDGVAAGGKEAASFKAEDGGSDGGKV